MDNASLTRVWIFAALIAFGCTPVFARGVALGNQFTYVIDGGVATVAVDEIRNDSTSPSAPLRLSLWASFTKPARGQPVSGSLIATFPNLAPLAAGAHYSNMTVTAPTQGAPRGNWWIVLVLDELTSQCAATGACRDDTLASDVRASFGAPLPPHALENPAPDSFQSGIGVVSGWSCEGSLFAMIDGRPPTMVLPWGAPRADTAGVCGGAPAAGFSFLLNYNVLGPGEHSIVLYQAAPAPSNSVALTDPVRFTVTVPAGEFARGLSRTIVVPDFPSPGRSTTLTWQESQQNFAIQSVSP